MNVYRFQKWYLDLITDDGDYLFCYLGVLNFSGIEHKEFAFTIAHPRARPKTFGFSIREKILSNNSPLIILRDKNRRFEVTETGFQIQFRRTDFDLSLGFNKPPRRFHQVSPLKITGAKKTSLLWFPLRLRAQVSGKLSFSDKSHRFQQSSGYTDFVDSNIIPFFVPIRRLFWGRFHSEQMNMAFAVILDSRRKLTGHMIVEEKTGEIYEIRDLQIDISTESFSRPLKMEYPTQLSVIGAEGDTFINLQITQNVIAIGSNFFDVGKSRWSIRRNILRFCARNPRGIKFFAKADFHFTREEKVIEAKAVDGISEYVRFF